MDERIVYSVGCTWWDSIRNVGKNGDLPACPHCGSVLCEVPNESEWFETIDRYEKNGHPGYRKLIEWLRGKCFKTTQEGEGKMKNETTEHQTSRRQD